MEEDKVETFRQGEFLSV